ncbi:MAG: TM0996/MTH895 family glutaredoxin-like protein [Lachnospiraceae bacterium]|nr:TM0996/MTH895 family glutaredoxin-like protein [Lachnospiraceae bacterium]
MGLFNFKKEERCCSNDMGGNPVSIKVLGLGCKSCHELYENTKKAVKNAGLSVEVEYITDPEKIMEYGVMSMPGLVVNEKVVSVGKVLKAGDVEKLLQKHHFPVSESETKGKSGL